MSKIHFAIARLVIVSLLLSALNLSAAPPALARPAAAQEASFFDHFDGSLLNTALWMFGTNGANSGYSVSGSQLAINGGVTNGGGAWVLSSPVYTLTAGVQVFEAHLHTSSASNDYFDWGLWGDNHDGAALFSGGPGEPFFVYTRPDNVSAIISTTLPGVDPTLWHTYRIELTQSEIRYFVDGQLKATHTTGLPLNKPMRARLDRGSTGTPQTLWVDWASMAGADAIAVNTTTDELNSDGDCSLREAVRAANLDSAVDACPAGNGADFISVPSGVYTLTLTGANENAALTGDLDLTDALTLVGAGVGNTVIDGDSIDRIVDVHGANVLIFGFTIQHGLVTGPAPEEEHGGGIRNTQSDFQAPLTITNVSLVANTASGAGGGLLTNFGSVRLSHSIFLSNTANAGGGGIANWGSMVVDDTLLQGNNGGAGAGGLYAVRDTIITNSLIRDNQATGMSLGNGGGGIAVPYSELKTVAITNTTISNNYAANIGGGLAYAMPVSLYNVTLANNSAGNGGGGIYRYDGEASLVNTIVANNTGGNCAGAANLTSQGFNLSSDATCPLSASGDLTNTNPLLGPLQDNGGATFTHELLPGSPAVNAGNNAVCPATDQRGVARPQNGICDIGAYEAAPPFELVSTPFTHLYDGAAEWGDYDGDGDLDLVVTGCDASCANGRTYVYRNDGATFAEQLLPDLKNSAAAWGDYDNDGDLDLALAGDMGTGYRTLVMRNDGGIFTDLNAPLTGVRNGALAWGDYDNDGDLDLLVSGCTSGWCASATSKIYRNAGGGVFTDIGAGLPDLFASSAAWGDYNNDGRFDLLLMGVDQPRAPNGFARLYRNEGNGLFTALDPGLPQGAYGEVAWGDADHDGWPDILLTGGMTNGNALPYIAGVYHNNGDGTFADSDAALPGAAHAAARWGDYDNDGALDAFLSGTIDLTCNPYSHIYRNAGGVFNDLNAGLLPVCYSSSAWGDYDNDGDLDMVLMGHDGLNPQTRLYRNNTPAVNQPPSTPTGLNANVNGSSATLNWNAASDAQTSANGLTYNVRVGTTPGGAQIVSPLAANTGQRYVAQLGNIQHGLTATLTNLAAGVYYWSVQAVDTAFAGSAFAAEGTFNIGVTTFSASGRIAESGGAGIPGVSVSAGPGLTALTDANGDYTVFNLITGTYTLTPTLTGYTFAPLTRTAIVPPNATALDFTGTPPAPTPPTGVTISGPESGVPNSAYNFNAAVTPLTATLPITYTWTPTPNTGQGVSNVSYLWETDGVKTITVTASNAGGSVQASHSITLTAPLTLGDNFEPDNTCAQSQSITTDGTVQPRTFHTAGDEDWVSVSVVSGTTYLIEAVTPAGSVADVGMLLQTACDMLPFGLQGYTYSPDVRYRFTANSTGAYRLRLTDSNSTGNPSAGYNLTVRALSSAPTPGAVVIVAGYLRANDPLQTNIHNVTNNVYKLFATHGYDASRLYYFAKDMNLDATGDGVPDVDAPPDEMYLNIAFTNLITQVATNRALTVFLMDHGGYDKFYLDGPANKTLSPDELDAWLDNVEAAVPGVNINVIVEACYSGSFIDLVKTVSKPGRVIITSTGASAVAYSSFGGAAFSDAFLASLGQDLSLYNGFTAGRDAAQTAHPDQTPWLDDNGDGLPNGPTDGQAAAQRGFAYAGTFADTLAWPPYLASAQVGSVIGASGLITVDVRDDPASHIVSVYAVVYKPSYRPPAPGEELAQETLPTVTLLDPNHDGLYTGLYEGFTERGHYRFVIYALDSDGLTAEPRHVGYGAVLYLPVIRK